MGDSKRERDAKPSARRVNRLNGRSSDGAAQDPTPDPSPSVAGDSGAPQTEAAGPETAEAR